MPFSASYMPRVWSIAARVVCNMLKTESNTGNSNTIKSDLQRLRSALIVFTILYFASIPIYFSGIVDSNVVITIILLFTLLINVVFIVFIWTMPMKKTDKIIETIMICLFGLIAMWAWLQFNNLNEKEKHTTLNT